MDAIAFSKCGRIMATAARDEQVQIWDAELLHVSYYLLFLLPRAAAVRGASTMNYSRLPCDANTHLLLLCMPLSDSAANPTAPRAALAHYYLEGELLTHFGSAFHRSQHAGRLGQLSA